jgi:hypothetical protein
MQLLNDCTLQKGLERPYGRGGFESYGVVSMAGGINRSNLLPPWLRRIKTLTLFIPKRFGASSMRLSIIRFADIHARELVHF